MKKVLISCYIIFFSLSLFGCSKDDDSDTWSCRILSSSNSSEVGLCWEETWSDSLNADNWCEAKVKSEIGFFSTNVTYKISNGESCP